MEGDRYPHIIYVLGRFGIKNHVEVIRGKLGVNDDHFSSLGLDKAEWIANIQKGECCLKDSLSVVGESKDTV